MKKKGLILLTIALVLLPMHLFSQGASESSYPNKNINIIVPYGAGGTTDLSTRGLLDGVAPDALPAGVNFLVTNMPGGSGLLGSTHFANSKKDGYTLGTVNCDLVLNMALGNTKLTADQFIPLVAIQADPYIIVVRKDSQFKTFEDLIDYALENPNEITIGDTGSGAVPHLATVAIEKGLGVKFKKVGYDDSGSSVIGVVSGEIDVTITHSSPAAGQLEAGEVRILGVTSNERLSTYPDVPAIGQLYEELADMKIISWIYVAALTGTEPEAVTFLQDVFGKAIKTDRFKNTLKAFSMQEVDMDGQEMLDFLASQYDYYMTLID